jgi:hypothetical protein
MANDITRLPKWAQDRIGDIERQVAALEAGIAERDAPLAATNTVVRGFKSTSNRPLPDGSTVGFGDFTSDPGALPWFQVRLTDRRGNGGVAQPGDLEIRGLDSPLVVPQVTNVVCVRLARPPR